MTVKSNVESSSEVTIQIRQSSEPNFLACSEIEVRDFRIELTFSLNYVKRTEIVVGQTGDLAPHKLPINRSVSPPLARPGFEGLPSLPFIEILISNLLSKRLWGAVRVIELKESRLHCHHAKSLSMYAPIDPLRLPRFF